MEKVDTIEIKNKLESTELFKISSFKEVIKRTKPHKHDGYLEIIYLSEGAGYHWIDTQQFQIHTPVVYFLSGQVHYWEMTSIPKGVVLLFKEELFDIFKHGELLNLIRSFEGTVEINLSNTVNLDFIFSELIREYKEPSANSVELTLGYLQVVLVKLLRSKQTHDAPAVVGNDSVYRKFRQLIQRSNPVSNLKVNEVASALNVSPQHLNTILKKASGKSASGIVIACIIDFSRLGVYFTRFSESGLHENLSTIIAATLSAFIGAYFGSKLLTKVTMESVQTIVTIMLIILSIALGLGLV